MQNMQTVDCVIQPLAATFALTQLHHRAPRELPTRLRERV